MIEQMSEADLLHHIALTIEHKLMNEIIMNELCYHHQ
jgi:hypothetical protein